MQIKNDRNIYHYLKLFLKRWYFFVLSSLIAFFSSFGIYYKLSSNDFNSSGSLLLTKSVNYTHQTIVDLSTNDECINLIFERAKNEGIKHNDLSLIDKEEIRRSIKATYPSADSLRVDITFFNVDETICLSMATITIECLFSVTQEGNKITKDIVMINQMPTSVNKPKKINILVNSLSILLSIIICCILITLFDRKNGKILSKYDLLVYKGRIITNKTNNVMNQIVKESFVFDRTKFSNNIINILNFDTIKAINDSSFFTQFIEKANNFGYDNVRFLILGNETNYSSLEENMLLCFNTLEDLIKSNILTTNSEDTKSLIVILVDEKNSINYLKCFRMSYLNTLIGVSSMCTTDINLIQEEKSYLDKQNTLDYLFIYD